MLKITKLFLLTVGLLIVFGWAVSLAQDVPPEVQLDETVEASDLGVPSPTLLPDNPFYFLKNWGRQIRTFFAFNPVTKMNLRERYASEKLVEVKKLVEKGKPADVIKKAIASYQKDIDKIKEISERIKEKARENPKIANFLDKFTKHQILHEKILEKLEEQVPQEAFEKIKQARERHLQRFGEVMQKLEDRKEKIRERLEKKLEEIKGSKFKQFKELEILKKLEEKVPTTTQEIIRKVRENILERLKERLEKMSTTTQQRFREYAEKIGGEAEKKLEIIQDLQPQLKGKIRERLENAKEKILKKIPEQIRLRRKDCPSLMPPAPDFCKEGRIIPQKDEQGCLTGFRCIVPGEEEMPQATSTWIEHLKPKPVCTSLWDPVCGKNGKTYSNECFAKVAGVEIAHRGICQEQMSFPKRIEKFKEKLEVPGE